MSSDPFTTPATPSPYVSTDWARMTPHGSEYVRNDPKHKGSPVVVVGVSSPSQLPGHLRSEWKLNLDQHLNGQSIPPAKAILKMEFIGKRENEWNDIRHAKIVEYNEVRRLSFVKDPKIKACDTRLENIVGRDKDCDNSIAKYESDIRHLQSLIAAEHAKKAKLDEEKHEVHVERSGHLVEKINYDNIAVGCLIEIGTIDYFVVTPRVERPFGQYNDVGQQGWGRAFGKYTRADCLEDNRAKAKFNLIAFFNMGATTTQTYSDLFTNPKICSPGQWAIQMGTRMKKLNLCHDTRSKVFGLPSDPKEVQHRNASLYGFPLETPNDSNDTNRSDDDGLIDSDTF